MADLRRHIVVTVDDREFQQHRADTKKFGAEASASFQKAARTIKGSIKSIDDADAVLKRLNTQFKNAATPQDRARFAALTKEVKRMRGEMAGTAPPATRLQKELQSIGRIAKRWIAGIAIAAIFALRQSLLSLVKTAISVESAFAGVNKTLDLTPQEFRDIQASIRSMAKELPTPVEDLAKIAEVAGRLGIEKENIVAFTRTMADLAETTNIVGEQGAESIAQFQNVMGEAGEDVDRLGATIVDLGNNTATSEADIISMAQRLAGAGKQAGLTQGEVLALGASMAELGIRAELGGTTMSRILLQMQKAATTGGDALKTFTALVPDFAEVFERDAAGAVEAFIASFQTLSKGDAIRALEGLGIEGIRVNDVILRLAGSGDKLRDNLDLQAKAWEENTALQIEAEKRYRTTAAQLGMLRNRFRDIAIDVGGQFFPFVKSASDALRDMEQPLRQVGTDIADLGSDVSSAVVPALVELTTRTLEMTSALIEAEKKIAELTGAAFELQGELINVLSLGLVEKFDLWTEAVNAFKAAWVDTTLALSTGGLSIILRLVDEVGKLGRTAQTTGASVEAFAARLGIATISVDEVRERTASLSAELIALGVAMNKTTEKELDLGGEGEADKIAAAEKALQAILNAQKLIARASADERKALAEVIDAQEEINRLKEIEATLGKDAVREAVQAARTRLEAAQETLSKVEGFRKTIEDAASSVEGAIVSFSIDLDTERLASVATAAIERIQDVASQEAALLELRLDADTLPEDRQRIEAEIAALNASALAQLDALFAEIEAEAPAVLRLLGTEFASAFKALRVPESAERQIIGDVERIKAETERAVEDIELQLALPGISDEHRRALLEDIATIKEEAGGRLRTLFEDAEIELPELTAALREAFAEGFNTVEVPPEAMRRLQTAIDAALTGLQLRRIELDIALREGAISKSDFDRELKAAAAKAKQALDAAFKNLPADLKKNLKVLELVADALGDIKDAGDDATESTEALVESLSNIASAIRAIARVADVFGDLNDEVRRLLDGTADVIDNFARLKDFQATIGTEGGPAAGSIGAIAGQAIPIIGAVAGVASILSGLGGVFGKNTEELRRQREALEELRQSLRDNARRIESAIDRLTKEATTGAGLTGEAAAGGQEALEAFEEERDKIIAAGGFTGTDTTAALRKSFLTFLETLEDLGIDVSAFRDQFLALLESGVPVGTAIKNILDEEGLRDLVKTLADDFGAAGQSVAGAIRLFDLLTKAGVDVADAFEDVRDFLLDLEDIPDEIKDKIRDADISTPEGREALQALAQSFLQDLLAGDIDLGGLTPEEFERLIDFFLSQVQQQQGREATGDIRGPDFGQTLSNATSALSLFTDVLGLEAPEAIRRFFDMLLAGASGASAEMQAILQEAAGLDLSTEEGRKRLRAIIEEMTEALIAGDAARFGVTPEQLEQLIRTLDAFADQAADTEGFSRSVQIGRTITEIQANELLALTESVLFTLQQIRALLGGDAPGRTGTRPEPDEEAPPRVPRGIRVQVPDAVQQSIQAAQVAATAPTFSAGTGTNNNIEINAPITIDRTLTDDVLRDIMDAFEREIYRNRNTRPR